MIPAALTGARLAPAGSRSAARDLILLGLVVLALVFAHWSALAAMVRMWNASPMYSYGFTVPFISAYLLWTRRGALAALEPRPAYAAGAAVLLCTTLVTVASRAAGVQVMEQVAFVVALGGASLLLLGWAYLRLGWAALGYLLFMVPLWDGFTEKLHAPFQLRSAELGVSVLHLIGIPAHREGVFISLPGLTLEVARACSGVNYLVAVLALGIPLAYVYLPTTWRRVVLLLSAVIVAGVSNGLRVALIGVLAHFEIGSPLHGPFHVLHGLFVAGVGYVVLFAGLRFLAPRSAAGGAAVNVAPARPEPRVRVSAWASAAILVVAVLVGSNAFARTPREVALDGALDSLPARLGDWSRERPFDVAPPREVAVWPGADAEVRRRYRRADGELVDVYIAYFASQDQQGELVNYKAGELHAKARPVQVPGVRTGGFEANLVVGAPGDAAILFWYEVDAAPDASRYAVKARTLWTAMVHGRSNGAVVALVSRSRDQVTKGKVLQELGSLVENALATRLPGRTRLQVGS